MKLKDYITLLFDADGNVAAAYPRSTVSADMQGIVTAIDEGKATVTLTNGITLRNMDIDKLEKPTALMGRLVSVAQTATRPFSPDARSRAKPPANGRFRTESSVRNRSLRVLMSMKRFCPAHRFRALHSPTFRFHKVPSSDIRYTVTDSAGTITTVILGDVTGDSWLYGMGYGEKNQKRFVFSMNLVMTTLSIIKKWSLYSDEEKKKYRDEHTSYFLY